MTDRKISAPWIAGAVLLVLIGGYVGAYYGMVVPVLLSSRPIIWPAYRHLWKPKVVVSSSFVPDMFTPIHWLDRRIRPHVWGP